MLDISGDDTRGTLLWNSGDLDDDHLICIVSEQAADDYLEDLRRKPDLLHRRRPRRGGPAPCLGDFT
jgi:hypothetical protein